MAKEPNIVHVKQDFDRNKVLDEALFVGICGLNMVRDECFITGVVRLEIARAKLDKVIEHIYAERFPKHDSVSENRQLKEKE